MATPAAPVTTLTGIAFADSEFDGQFLRALDTIFVGGADIGECFMTARRITPGDKDSWLAEWNATGDAVYAAAERVSPPVKPSARAKAFCEPSPITAAPARSCLSRRSIPGSSNHMSSSGTHFNALPN